MIRGLAPSRLSTYCTFMRITLSSSGGLAPSRLSTYCTRLQSSSISRPALATLATLSIQ